MPGNFVGGQQGCQVPFRPAIPNVGLLLRRCSGKGLHLAMTGEPRGFSPVAAGFERVLLAQGIRLHEPERGVQPVALRHPAADFPPAVLLGELVEALDVVCRGVEHTSATL